MANTNVLNQHVDIDLKLNLIYKIMVIIGSIIEMGRTKLCKCQHSKRDHQLQINKKKRIFKECLWHNCDCTKFVFLKEVPSRSHMSPNEPTGKVTLLHRKQKDEIFIEDL